MNHQFASLVHSALERLAFGIVCNNSSHILLLLLCRLFVLQIFTPPSVVCLFTLCMVSF